MTSRYNALPEKLAAEIIESTKAVNSASAACSIASHRRRDSSAKVRRVIPEVELMSLGAAADAADPDESGPQLADANKR